MKKDELPQASLAYIHILKCVYLNVNTALEIEIFPLVRTVSLMSVVFHEVHSFNPTFLDEGLVEDGSECWVELFPYIL